MKFFSTDSPLYRFLSTLFEVMKVNLLWLLCSLPVVTIGASTVAAYTILLRMADGTEGYIAKPFLTAFRANLKKGIPLGLLGLVAAYAVYLDFQFFSAVEDNPVIFLIMGIIAAFFFTLAFIYAFPLMARYENTVFGTLKNSYDIATRYFLRTLFLVFLVAVEAVIFLWNSTLVFIGLFVGPATVMYTISAFALRFFKEIEKENRT